MSTVTRGVRGVWRNPIRTTGVTIILALSVGLSLVMLLALKTVESRISSVKSSIANTISIAPAGFSNFSSANNALSTSDLTPLAQIAHVTKLTQILTDRLTTIGSTAPSFGGQNSGNNNNGTTSLTSPVILNANRGAGRRFFVNGGGSLPANFSLPITITGTTDPTMLNSQTLTISNGSSFSGTSDTNDALISSQMASKNALHVGSTFTAYGATLKVAGIFTSSSTQAAAGNVIVSLPAEQRLSAQSGDVTSATATVDSVDNLASATTAIKNKLGASADVENSQDEANSAIAPLQSIKTISFASLIGALIAGGLIIFLTMLMIVRERRREIGVLKAIGASNFKIMAQFVSESLTLTLLGAVVGTIGGVLLSNPVLGVLVSSSASTGAGGGGGAGGAGGGFRAAGGFAGAAGRGFGRAFGGAGRALTNLHTSVGYEILLYGLAAAVVIAIIGSALPAWLIARIRPAEVLRGE